MVLAVAMKIKTAFQVKSSEFIQKGKVMNLSQFVSDVKENVDPLELDVFLAEVSSCKKSQISISDETTIHVSVIEG